MMKIPVKICGIRLLEDAIMAVDSGAWALGFNFYPKSPRYLVPEKAAELIRQLAGTGIVTAGVFVNESVSEIQRIRTLCGLDYVQLCGDETWQDRHAVGGKIIQTIRPKTPDDLPDDDALRHADILLLDAPLNASGLYGGTGRKASAECVDILKQRGHRVLLAGGVNPDNARSWYDAYRPWGLDLASGVESAPGVKDHGKLQQLFNTLR